MYGNFLVDIGRLISISIVISIVGNMTSEGILTQNRYFIDRV